MNSNRTTFNCILRFLNKKIEQIDTTGIDKDKTWRGIVLTTGNSSRADPILKNPFMFIRNSELLLSKNLNISPVRNNPARIVVNNRKTDWIRWIMINEYY